MENEGKTLKRSRVQDLLEAIIVIDHRLCMRTHISSIESVRIGQLILSL